MARIILADQLTAAREANHCNRHSCDSSPTKASTAARVSVLAAGSSDTVTLVSEVETSPPTSRDSEYLEGIGEKANRVPLPTVSIDTNENTFLYPDALTCAPPSPPCAVMTVPCNSGVCVRTHTTECRIAYRHDATGMQYFGARAGYFLRFIVFQRAQQARSRHGARFALNMPGTSVQISKRRACS